MNQRECVKGIHKARADRCDSPGSEDSSGGHHPGPSCDSPQRARRRLPDSQAGIQQQRPESAHSIQASQTREHWPLLHQPRQPRAGALANLGSRVLELPDRSKVSGGAVRTRARGSALELSPPQPSTRAPGLAVPSPHLFQQLRRRSIVIFLSSPVPRCCRLGLTVAGRGELRSLEAFRPALSHGDAQSGDRPRKEGNGKLWRLRSS